MRQVVGDKNYKKEVLLEIIKDMLPIESYAWAQVEMVNKERYGKEETRSMAVIKCHWVETMCNKVKH